MRHSAYFPVAVLVATISAAPAHAVPRNLALAHMGLSGGNNAAWTLSDDNDEPSVVVATGDFNRDGIADMVESKSGSGIDSGPRFLTVLLGQRDGTFKRMDSDNEITGDPHELVVGDFNGDGNPDVIVGDSDGVILEFLGDGNGNLASAGNVATFGSVASIAIGHFTNGGHLDLVVSDVRSNSAAILLGGGDGSFRLTWSFELPKRGTEFHVATADFNKDGIADLVITSEDDENFEVMLGNGNGTFTYSPELSHLRDPNSYCPS